MDDAVSRTLLKNLLEITRDGERGFALATRDNQEAGVAEILREGEESSRTATIELHEQIRLLGGTAQELDAPALPVYRGWTSFKAVRISRDTKLILEDCERGEDFALRHYEAAIKVELPDSARVTVERQYRRVLAIQGRLRLLRNRYPASMVARARDSQL